MMAAETKNLLKELKDKLMLAESAEEIKKMIAKAGSEITAEDAEIVYDKISRQKAASGMDIDDDEMDAVAGGGTFSNEHKDWSKDGCAATCEPGSRCWSNDQCTWGEYSYSNFWSACPDGSPHNMVFVEDDFMSTTPIKRYKCSKCGFTKIE